MHSMVEEDLGKAVRELRERARLTLRALAARTGFSASFLSQVENGQASPSISSMEKIATALGVSLGEFFLSTEVRVTGVVRAGSHPVLTSQWSKAQVVALGSGHPGMRLEPMQVTLDPGGSSAKAATASPLEEFALVLAGKVILTLDDEEQELTPGDSVTIAPGVARRWHNAGETPANVVMVRVRPPAP